MRNCNKNHPERKVLLNHRGGFTLFEAFISMILVGATMAVALPAFKAIGQQRKDIDQRYLVIIAVGNLAERIRAESSGKDLSQERLNNYQSALIGELDLNEPQAELSVVNTDDGEVSGVRQVAIKVSWRNIYGENVDPVTLTLWLYE